jgi:hypothetical protein
MADENWNKDKFTEMVKKDGDKIIKISEEVESYLKDTLLNSEPVNVLYRKMIDNKKKVINSSYCKYNIYTGVSSNNVDTPSFILSAEYSDGSGGTINEPTETTNNYEQTTSMFDESNSNETSDDNNKTNTNNNMNNNTTDNNDDSEDDYESDNSEDAQLFEKAAKKYSIPREMLKNMKEMGDNFKQRSRNYIENAGPNFLNNVWDVIIDCITQTPGMADINIFRGFTRGLKDIFRSMGYETSDSLYDYYHRHDKFAINYKITLDKLSKMNDAEIGKFLDDTFALAGNLNKAKLSEADKASLGLLAAIINMTFELYINNKKVLLKTIENLGIETNINSFFDTINNNSKKAKDPVDLVIAAVDPYNKYIKNKKNSRGNNPLNTLISSIMIGISEGMYRSKIPNRKENNTNNSYDDMLTKFSMKYNNTNNLAVTLNVNGNAKDKVAVDTKMSKENTQITIHNENMHVVYKFTNKEWNTEYSKLKSLDPQAFTNVEKSIKSGNYNLFIQSLDAYFTPNPFRANA